MKDIIQAGVYLPPEALRGDRYASSGDIYSFAILIWELWQGDVAFDNCRDASLKTFCALLDKPFHVLNKPKRSSNYLPSPLAKLLDNCMHSNPSDRPDIKIFEDEWNGIN